MFGFDPFTYLLARLGTSLGLGAAVLLILLLVFGGRILGFLLRSLRAARAAGRRGGRKAGQRLCAECAAELAAEGVWGRCPECRGTWVREADLAALLAARKKPAREWTAEAGAVVPRCPECAQGLAAGRFVGEDFAVFRCGPCAGLWLGAAERISFDLRVLG
ncbi:MAG: zf-TFIIB domain-containing protein [Elusimicrobia bacterium]|nr:zf-TFIIB domain-containing protein [Elusimicrobiota bacterium]